MQSVVYGETVNAELLRLFRPGARVLDIGCGTGAWADELRRAGASELVGVEVVEDVARVAGSRYDEVIELPIERVRFDDDLHGRRFDTVVAADVLEHLVDPWSELRRWSRWADQLVISTPNLRYFRVLAAVVLRGRFDYQPGGGIMDETHLRWFTLRSLVDQLRRCGWDPTACDFAIHGNSAHVDRLTGHSLKEFLAGQLRVVARSQHS